MIVHVYREQDSWGMRESAHDRDDADRGGRRHALARVAEDRIRAPGRVVCLVLAMEHADDVPLDRWFPGA